MRTSRQGWSTGPGKPLLAVLLMMFVLSGILAYQAWDAARSHRQVTEAALRDYAHLALWELQRRVESTSRLAMTSALIPAVGGRLVTREMPRPGIVTRLETRDALSTELRSFGLAVENALRLCGCERSLRHFFWMDLESSVIEIHDSRGDNAFQGWLRTAFLEYARSATASGEFAATVQTQAEGTKRIIALPADLAETFPRAQAVPIDPSLVIIYMAVQGDTGERLYGFAIDLHTYTRALIDDAISGPPLLPASLTGSVRNDEVLSVAVWTAAGDTIIRARRAVASSTRAVDTLRLVTGPLVAALAVQPTMAGRLVIGGLPASRLPILLGSFGLTLILIIIAGLQLRRQQELFRLRSDFVSGVSHELRTPLAQIHLLADLLASGRLTAAQRERSLRILTAETQRLTYLVQNVLRFSRSGRLTERVVPAPTPIEPLLREIVEEFQPLARSRDVAFELAIQEGIEAPVDSDAIRQIMLNLLDNAVKYGPRGQRVDIRASIERESLRIEVDDRGPGIPVEERRRIWEPYRRLERDVEAATGGSGIGLAVVRELVALHGGTAEVSERPGGGSRFVVLLPGGAVSGAESPDRHRVGAEV